MSRSTIGFAGMTHLGLNSAVAAAERGFNVVGFDVASRHIESLERRELPMVEPDLPELLGKNQARLTFTDRIGDLAACDVVYVSPDVPTDDQGRSELSGVRALIGMVDAALRPETVLVVLSQVPPGFTRSLSRPSDRRFYQVETLIFGRAIERALHPERFIVGCADPAAALPAPLANFLSAFGCPILPMRYESAELAKVSINMFLIASISTTNALAELCETIGADWSAPGLGIAGGNLERDLTTVCELANARGSDAGVVRAYIANSRHRRDWVLTQIHERVLARKSDPVVAVLGLAYKQDTSSTKNSPSLALLAALKPFAVRVFDPGVPPRPEFHPRLFGAASALEACAGADVLTIMTPWDEFRRLAPRQIAERLRGRMVIDPYAVLDAGDCRAAGLDYITLGAAPISDGA
jgi:UDPglucose 6-dehydrogenase